MRFYEYLGVTLKSNGGFSEHIDKIKDKGFFIIYLTI